MKYFSGFVLLFLLAFTKLSFSQDFKLSPYASISILSCEPGTDLYAAFGHSAIRVTDPMLSFDIIYNYGIFDFYAPGFYTNFIKGKLTYSLGRQNYSDFIYEYDIASRTVSEQVLDIDGPSMNKLFNYLEKNYRPENRDYAYDFFYNNCATKIRDLIEDKSILPRVYKLERPTTAKKSFRGLLEENFPANNWAMFGMNLALGAKVDKAISFHEAQFLPAYLSEQLNHYTMDGKPLVKDSLAAQETKKKIRTPSPLWQSPAFWSILLVLVSFGVFVYSIFSGVQSFLFDGLLLGMAGLISLLIIGLWFFTDHSPTVSNFNLLWASPLAIVVLIGRGLGKEKLVKVSSSLLLLLLLSCPVVHYFGIQKFDALFFPLMAALAFRVLPLQSKKMVLK